MIGLLLFLLFIVLPLVELALLVYIGSIIGVWYTVAIVLATGFLGAVLARTQGMRAWRDVRQAMAEGRVPGRELVAGALFLVGAAFLLTPGVITDTVGFLFMVPVVRLMVARGVIRVFRRHPGVRISVSGFGRPAAPGGAAGTEPGHGPGRGGAPAPGDDPDAPRVVRTRRVEDDGAR